MKTSILKGGFKSPLSFLKNNWLVLLIGVVILLFLKPIIEFVKSLFGIANNIADSTKSAFEKLGIGESKGSEAFNYIVSQPDSFWNPLFVRYAPSGAKLLTYSAKQSFAAQIYNAWGFFHKDYDTTIGVFHQISAQSQVSDLAQTFFEVYKKDLVTFLRPATWSFDFRNYPSSEQFLQINNYLKQLKQY